MYVRGNRLARLLPLTLHPLPEDVNRSKMIVAGRGKRDT